VNCAFVSCAEASACGLEGGCVARRFAPVDVSAEQQLPKSKALNGTLPRPSRDPWFIKRHRKALAK